MQKKEFGALHTPPSLTIVQGEGIPSRFARADRLASSLGREFFGLVHKTLNFQGPFVNLRRILREVDLKKEERPLYQPWLDLNSWQAVEQAQKRRGVSQERLAQLEAQDDPYIHIRDSLERFRTQNLPELEGDVVMREKTFVVYALIATSLHGRVR